MNQEPDILQRAKRMVPLIRSITNEARDRTRAIRDLEARLQELSTRPGNQIAEIHSAEFELFFQRREIERLQKELGRLGCSMDADQPERIVWHVADTEVAFEERLDETGFRPDRSGFRNSGA